MIIIDIIMGIFIRDKIKKHSYNWNAFKITIKTGYLLSRIFLIILIGIRIILRLILVRWLILISRRYLVLWWSILRSGWHLVLSGILLDNAFLY